MAASSIPIHASSTSTRAQSRAGGWIASFDFDLATTRTTPLPTLASTNESLHDSSTTTSTFTGPFCCNQQYSVTAITTSTGAIAERYAYTAYGQPTILNASGLPLAPQSSTLSNRYSYTGREWDATLGLHHFRARWMSPMTGRFLGRDPIGYVDGSHAYVMVSNRSLKYVDPLGLKCEPVLTGGIYEAFSRPFSQKGYWWWSGDDYIGFNEFAWVPTDDSLFSLTRIAVWSRHMPAQPPSPGIGGVPGGYAGLDTFVNCKISCTDKCDIVIACSATPNGGGLEDEWNGTHSGDRYAEGIFSTSAYQVRMNGSGGTLNLLLEAAFLIKTAGWESSFGLDISLAPFGLGGSFSGGMTAIHEPKVTKLPKNDTKKNPVFSWECKCREDKK